MKEYFIGAVVMCIGALVVGSCKDEFGVCRVVCSANNMECRVQKHNKEKMLVSIQNQIVATWYG